jgi:integral membrane protein (TIGR00529 family)
MEFSAIAKILIVFAGLLVISRMRTPLGLVLIGGGLCLELWAGKNPPAVVADLLHAVQMPELWLLLINIALILEFGYFLAEKKNSDAIINAARRWGGKHGQAFSLVLVPAAIGLVPMPGGALFSAPLVDQTTRNGDWPSPWKAAVNYWFRHVLEYWWPLYPVVIVSLSIFTIRTWQFMMVQIPFTLVSIGAGYFFLLRRRHAHLREMADAVSGKRDVLAILAPLLLVVLCTLILPLLISRLFPAVNATMGKLLAMLVGLIGGLTLLAGNRGSRRQLFRYLFTCKTGKVLLTLAGVMIFQSLLKTSGLLPLAGEELAAGQVPLLAIISILPFIAGLVTGIAIGFAGTAFPLVVGLMGITGSGLTPMATLVLAFTMGYAGMMLSPVHLCLLLTREYFSSPYFKVLRYILPCTLTVVTYGLLLHLTLHVLGW